ncbi:MAG: hypothetical protein E7267_07860 [Lachnospiraceae bacterium]|nr:hypothetical protein [Lachnospiraceae bacterium]
MTDLNAQTSYQEKDCWFDNAKAFLIISVILGHFLSTVMSFASFETTFPKWVYVIYKTIYIFHMPVFMAISGRFSKRRVDSNDYVSVIKKVIVPYIIADTLLMLFFCALGYHSISDFSYLNPMYGMWYLFTIAFYQLISPYIVKYRFTFFVAIIVAIAANFFKFNLYGGFQRILTFYPFFLLGYYTATNSFSFCRKKLFRAVSVLSFVLLALFTYRFFDYICDLTLTTNTVYSEIFKSLDVTKLEYLFIILIRYALGFAFFIFTLGIAPTKKNVFTKLGTYSVYIYILHLFVVVFIRSMDKQYGIMDNINTNPLIIIFCLMVIPISFVLVSSPVRKLTGWIVAPKFKAEKK